MTDESIKAPGRRAFLCALAASPVTALVAARAVQAQGTLPHLSPADAQAKSYGYVEDATKVAKASNPTYKPGQHCANCVLLQGKAGDAWRPCSLFPGKVVAANGWCRVWAAKPA